MLTPDMDGPVDDVVPGKIRHGGTLTPAAMIDHDWLVVHLVARAYDKMPLHRKPHAAGTIQETPTLQNSFKLIAVLAAAIMLSAPVQAAEMCGAETVTEGSTSTATFGALKASCETGSICSVVLASGNDLNVAIERASVEGSWLVVFAGTSSIDTGAGVDLVFDGTDETRVAPEFLIASEDRNTVRVDDDVSQIMVSTLTEAKSMTSIVQFVGGKKINVDAEVGELGQAMTWVDCAQAKQ
jgi:hypothetical protein